ncbi:YdeI family protein [Mucilaginibacter terrae]|uniref:YdeI/OmpD-associated family protein n=1 Tax=Mucilaginibacter terrae TaxID=1955052 RepID=UPI0036285106
METKDGVKTFHARSRAAWRQWLAKNHQSETSVWLIIYRKESKTSSVYYPEAVDEALCFGWIDSKPNKRDEESYYQFFSKRNAKSNWSKVNKLKVEKLLQQNLMMPAGLAIIELAKQSGTWNALHLVDEVMMPDDLQEAFKQDAEALANWEKFSRSSRRGILEWIFNAKRPETRQKRIVQTVILAGQNIKVNHPIAK